MCSECSGLLTWDRQLGSGPRSLGSGMFVGFTMCEVLSPLEECGLGCLVTVIMSGQGISVAESAASSS